MGCMGMECPKTPNCLHVFTHSPAHLPKCYCSPNQCSNRPEDFAHTCPSGELHEDLCGICLVCARARGQSCGGQGNRSGVCAGGLLCKVATGRNEQRSTGICVSDTDSDCPKSSVADLGGGNSKKKFNCRPGRRGILSEALYCPKASNCDLSKSTEQTSTTVQQQRPRPANSRKRPTLLQVLANAASGK